MSDPVLVTGANSFIGAALVRRLLETSDAPIVATYRANRDALPAPVPERLRNVACDFTDPAAVGRLFDGGGFSSIVHLAAARPGATEAGFAAVAAEHNVTATANLLQAALAGGCRRFVFVSAIGVYDGIDGGPDGYREDQPLRPSSIFGWSKWAGEELIRVHCGAEMSGVALRMPGVHGPGKPRGAVFHFLNAALAGEPLKVAEPHSRFRLLFIDDAVESIRLALRSGLPGPYEVYNVAGHEVWSLIELARQVIDVVGSQSALQVAENARARSQILAIDKIREQLGFRPAPARDHLSAYRAALRDAAASGD